MLAVAHLGGRMSRVLNRAEPEAEVGVEAWVRGGEQRVGKEGGVGVGVGKGWLE